jgi:large subunit ribosomal protein L23
MKNLYDVIRRPLITEKSSILKETQGTLCFEVHRDATKPEIKKAVEQLLGTKVADVRVSNVRGKLKRQGRFVGRRPDWKKAYVVLKKGEKMIEFYEQA